MPLPAYWVTVISISSNRACNAGLIAISFSFKAKIINQFHWVGVIKFKTVWFKYERKRSSPIANGGTRAGSPAADVARAHAVGARWPTCPRRDDDACWPDARWNAAANANAADGPRNGRSVTARRARDVRRWSTTVDATRTVCAARPDGCKSLSLRLI